MRLIDVSNIILYQIIQKINSNDLMLASLPNVISEVNEVLSKPNITAAEVAHAIQQDVALSTRILRIANNPIVFKSKEVDSMVEAVTLLGIPLVKNLAVCSNLTDNYTPTNDKINALMTLNINISVRRSAVSYIVAKYMSKHLQPEMALMIGLMSKVGHITVLRHLNDTDEHNHLTPDEIETIAYDIGDIIGITILQKWHFPVELINSIFGCGEFDLSNIVTYRDAFVLAQKYSCFKNPNSTRKKVHFPSFDIVDRLIETHIDEYKNLETFARP